MRPAPIPMPDPNCPDCKGTGHVTLLTSRRPCGCPATEKRPTVTRTVYTGADAGRFEALCRGLVAFENTGPAVTGSPAAIEYRSLRGRLDALCKAGRGEGAEAESLRDEMDGPWHAVARAELDAIG